MVNFRQFDAGPDPFGHKFQILFKWLQTAISIRGADTVDVQFILVDEDNRRTKKTIALPHADLVQLSKESGHPLEDPWCARIAALHLKHLIETGEDMEKDIVTVLPPDLKRYAAEIGQIEKADLAAR